MSTATLEQARARRDDGIERAAEHAGPEWQATALRFVTTFARGRAEPFLAEQAREYAEKLGCPPPPDPRAWGHVMRAAARANVVRKVGYAPAASSNLSPKVQWQGVVP